MAISEYSKNWLRRAQQSREDSLRETREFEKFIQQYRIEPHRSKRKKQIRDSIAIENSWMKYLVKEMYLENKNKPLSGDGGR